MSSFRFSSRHGFRILSSVIFPRCKKKFAIFSENDNKGRRSSALIFSDIERIRDFGGETYSKIVKAAFYMFKETFWETKILWKSMLTYKFCLNFTKTFSDFEIMNLGRVVKTAFYVFSETFGTKNFFKKFWNFKILFRSFREKFLSGLLKMHLTLPQQNFMFFRRIRDFFQSRTACSREQKNPLIKKRSLCNSIYDWKFWRRAHCAMFISKNKKWKWWPTMSLIEPIVTDFLVLINWFSLHQ